MNGVGEQVVGTSTYGHSRDNSDECGGSVQMFPVLAFGAVLIGTGIWGIVKRAGNLKFANTWRGPRLLIFGGIFLSCLLLPSSRIYLLVVGAAFVFFLVDIALGTLATEGADPSRPMTLGQEVRATFSGVHRGCQSIARDVGNVIAPNGWKSDFRLRSDGFIARLLNTVSRNADVPFAVALKFLIALVLLSMLTLLGIGVPLLFAWIVSGDSDSAVLFQRMGEVYLYAYGPYIVTVWLIASAVIALLGLFVRISGDERRPFRSILYFSASSGVGAAIGLISGLMAPPLWDMVSMTPFATLLSPSPPASEGLALSCSTLGTVFGALIGTYLSVRDRLASIGNLIYREGLVFGLIISAAWLVCRIRSLSPHRLVQLLAERSNFASHNECLAVANFKSLNVSDVAKCFLFEDEGFILSSNDVFWAMFWILLVAGCSRFIAEFVKNSSDSGVGS